MASSYQSKLRTDYVIIGLPKVTKNQILSSFWSSTKLWPCGSLFCFWFSKWTLKTPIIQFSFTHIQMWYLVLLSTASFGPNPFLTYFFFLLMRGPVKFAVEIVGLNWMRRKGVMMCSFGTAGLLLLTTLLKQYQILTIDSVILTVMGVICKGNLGWFSNRELIILIIHHS